MDCTYKVVPPNTLNFKLMILSGLDLHENKTVLCALILLSKENEITFQNIFEYLNNKYDFKPRRFMSDFNTAQLKAIQTKFPDCKISTCFFHFSQAIWKNFKKTGLCGKGTYNNNMELLFNIQVMCFIERNKIDSYFSELKKHYNNNKYKKFLAYFSRTWLGTR